MDKFMGFTWWKDIANYQNPNKRCILKKEKFTKKTPKGGTNDRKKG